MDFPPRPGSGRGRGEDLDIDFAPLREQRAEPAPRRAIGRRPRRRPEPETPPRRGSRSETLARVLWVVPWIVFVVLIVAVGGLLFAIAMAALASIGLAELFRMTSDVHP